MCDLHSQLSTAPCIDNISFHCSWDMAAGFHRLKVSKGCRGVWHCGGTLTSCHAHRVTSLTCRCDAVHSPPLDVSRLLTRDALREYSTRLYGVGPESTDSVPELLWLALLPAKVVAAIAERVGACRLRGSPARPFYWTGCPRDALWVQDTRPPGRGKAFEIGWSHNFSSVHTFPNGTWVEVVHCAANFALPSSYHGQYSAFWTYPARGSGVWMNVGRTFVTPSYSHAMHLLHQAYGQTLNQDGREQQQAPTQKGLDFLRNYDSIQILYHFESSTHGMMRSEIMFLQAGREIEPFGWPIARCGRPPHRLRPCSTEHLLRFAKGSLSAHDIRLTGPNRSAFGEGAGWPETCAEDTPAARRMG